MVTRHVDPHIDMLLFDFYESRGEWRPWPRTYHHYSLEDELHDQLDKLPGPDEVRELITQLRVPTLRDLSAEVVNGSVAFLRGGNRLDFLKLMNSWIATAEETVAAGSRLKRIIARRATRRTAPE